MAIYARPTFLLIYTVCHVYKHKNKYDVKSKVLMYNTKTKCDKFKFQKNIRYNAHLGIFRLLRTWEAENYVLYNYSIQLFVSLTCTHSEMNNMYQSPLVFILSKKVWFSSSSLFYIQSFTQQRNSSRNTMGFPENLILTNKLRMCPKKNSNGPFRHPTLYMYVG